MKHALPILGLILSLGMQDAPARAGDDVGVNIEFYRRGHEQAELMAAAGIR